MKRVKNQINIADIAEVEAGKNCNQYRNYYKKYKSDHMPSLG